VAASQREAATQSKDPYLLNRIQRISCLRAQSTV